MMREYNFASMPDTGEIYRYEESKGVYVDDGKIVSEIQLESISPDITTHKVNEILAKIRRNSYVDRRDFDANPDIRNFKNGLFDVSTGKLEPHTPDYLSLIQLPVKYDKKTTCRPIIEALYNTFEDPTDVPLFLEWLAYNVFWKNKDLQKEMLLVGLPECAKSVVLNWTKCVKKLRWRKKLVVKYS